MNLLCHRRCRRSSVTVGVAFIIILIHVALAAASNENDIPESSVESWLEFEHVMGRDLFESRIVGGTTATEGEFPFFGTWSDTRLFVLKARCSIRWLQVASVEKMSHCCG
jgi:hypothetical protein